MHKKITIIQSLLIISCCFILAIAFASSNKKTTTMDNLNHALKGETNASHKYELFAKRADKEGYKQVAKLFRAVSMAESTHINNHKAVILSLGGKPDIINYDAVEVKSTKENLQVPLMGETYEKDIMYPNFIRQAVKEKLPGAVKTFTYAQDAEKQHEKLFQNTLKNIGKKTSTSYCVSRISGATYAVTSATKCPYGKVGGFDEYIRIK